MYGLNMLVAYDGLEVALRPLGKADLPVVASHFSSMKVHMYTQGLYAQTLENEEEWYEEKRKDITSCSWGIVPKGATEVVGVTGLNYMDMFGSCVSGIIIWDTNWWGKGVATRAHLGRTLFAADYLARTTIRSGARMKNNASMKALLRVGYVRTGVEPRTSFRAGEYMDTQLFCWIHPEKVDLLFPEDLPEMYKEGVGLAGIALKRAREVVSFP